MAALGAAGLQATLPSAPRARAPQGGRPLARPAAAAGPARQPRRACLAAAASGPDAPGGPAEPLSGEAAASGGGNGPLAGLCVAGGVALFIGLQLSGGGPTLTSLAAASVPLDVAMANGRPTVIEIYADWCAVCRQMVPAAAAAERVAAREQVNFVMLNADNGQWVPEMLQYRVRGIPHFEFLDGAGHTTARAVGKQPQDVLLENVRLLAATARAAPAAVTAAAAAASAPAALPMAAAGVALDRDGALASPGPIATLTMGDLDASTLLREAMRLSAGVLDAPGLELRGASAVDPRRAHL